MSDEIDEIVDWQLASQPSLDKTRRYCSHCATSWNDPIQRCPECDRRCP